MTAHNAQESSQERFDHVLRLLTEKITQQEIAQRLNVPPQYVSDVKSGRRVVTELFARRLSDEFGIDYRWLLYGEGSMKRPTVNKDTGHSSDVVALPVLPAPILGDPRSSLDWDGSTVEIAGRAASIARKSKNPFVLRLDHDDHFGRMKKNDLILITQEEVRSDVAIVLHKGKLVIARRDKREQWRSQQSGVLLKGDAKFAAGCVAIIWAAL